FSDESSHWSKSRNGSTPRVGRSAKLAIHDGVDMSSATRATDLPFTGLPRDVAALNELKAIPQWVAWRYEARGGSKPTKPPVNPHTGGYARCASPATWRAYEQAERRARAGSLPGVRLRSSDEDT